MDVKQAPSEDAIVLSYSWILNVVISFISSYHPQTLFILNASIPALISPRLLPSPCLLLVPSSQQPTYTWRAIFFHLLHYTLIQLDFTVSHPLSGFLIPRSPIPLTFYKRIW